MSERIRVATYNLYLGADLSLLLGDVPVEELDASRAEVLRQLDVTAFPGRAPAIARLLVRERVDLVGLQEVCTWHADGKLLWDCLRELLAALEALDEPYDVVVSQPSFIGSGEVEQAGRPVTMQLEGSNVILRRRSSAVVVAESSSGMFDNAFSTRLMETGRVSIERGWCAARCTVAGASSDLVFVNTHTEAYEPASRDRQRTELVAALPDAPRLVLVGDFNAEPDEVGMPGELVDAWSAVGNPEGPEAVTCCQAGDLSNEKSELTERIDYVWVRRLVVERCTRFGADEEDRTEQGLWPSDHAGVVATVVLD